MVCRNEYARTCSFESIGTWDSSLNRWQWLEILAYHFTITMHYYQIPQETK
jgi:hypothetical protein